MPQAKVEELRSILIKAIKRRFRKPSQPKYGTINKGFTEQELAIFFRCLKSEKFRLLFKFQAQLGLRVGEACSLHVSNIDFDKRELTIETEKARKMDSLLIPMELFKELVDFINSNKSDIERAKGFIFFKEHDNNRNGLPHIEVNYTRTVFRDTIKAAGLDFVYGHSEETYQNHRERPLYRLSTHSLRHYAITRFAKSTNGNVVKASKFVRHSKPDVTMRYINTDKSELFNDIDMAFSNNLNSLKSLSNRYKNM